MFIEEALAETSAFGLGKLSSRTRFVQSLPIVACFAACLIESPVFSTAKSCVASCLQQYPTSVSSLREKSWALCFVGGLGVWCFASEHLHCLLNVTVVIYAVTRGVGREIEQRW